MMTIDRDPYERSLCDHAFADRVQLRYHGSYATVDALWWLVHPKECSPSGIASPTLEVRRLEGLVYAKGSDERSRSESAVQLEKVKLALAGEREFIRTAVIDDSLVPIAFWHPSFPDEIGHFPELVVPPPRAGPASRWPGLALAVAIGVGLGVATAQLLPQDVFPPGPSTTNAAEVAGVASPASDPAQALLKRFLAPKGSIALSAATSLAVAAAGIDSATLIGMPVSTPYGMPSLNSVYVAEGMEGRFCLLAVDSGGHVSTSCSAAAAVEEWGLRLSWTTTDYMDGPRTPRVIIMTAVLTPAGELRISRVRAPDGVRAPDATHD